MNSNTICGQSMNKSMCVKHYHCRRKIFSFDWNTLNFTNGGDHCFTEKITACSIFFTSDNESQCFVTNSLSKMVLYTQAELKSKLVARVQKCSIRKLYALVDFYFILTYVIIYSKSLNILILSIFITNLICIWLWFSNKFVITD